MFFILGWLLYGLLVGLVAKFLHPGDDPVGFLPTVGIGIAGSYLGGFILWLINGGGPFTPAGFIMGIVGGVLFCWLYKKYNLSKVFELRKKK